MSHTSVLNSLTPGFGIRPKQQAPSLEDLIDQIEAAGWTVGEISTHHKDGYKCVLESGSFGDLYVRVTAYGDTRMRAVQNTIKKTQQANMQT
jgi:hypothetical protein